MISVIVPTLNEEKYIEMSLKALKNQDYNGKYEIIVADGNSKDGTVKIAKNYADKIVSVKKRGIGAGRNAGAKAAKGDILTFVDADTILLPNTLKEIESAFKKKSLVVLSVVTLPMDYSLKSLLSWWFINTVSKNSCKYGKALMPGYCLSCRKETFDKIDGFNEELKSGEEIDMSLRMNKHGKAEMLDTTLAFTSTRRLKKWGPTYSAYKYFKGYILGKYLNKGGYEPVR